MVLTEKHAALIVQYCGLDKILRDKKACKAMEEEQPDLLEAFEALEEYANEALEDDYLILEFEDEQTHLGCR